MDYTGTKNKSVGRGYFLFDTFRKFHVTFWSGGQSDSRQKSVLDRYEDLVAEELADKSNSEILGSEFNDQMFVKLAMFY